MMSSGGIKVNSLNSLNIRNEIWRRSLRDVESSWVTSDVVVGLHEDVN